MPPNGMLIPLMAGLTLSSMALIQAHKGSKVHESIAQAERAFSARCGEVGFKKSFLENFHSRGVFFSPKPAFAVDDLKNQPDDPLHLATILEWAPAVVDVSAAGDMGYTTGPLTIRAADNARPPSFGQYFSVWTRDKDTAPWRVILDFGTRTKTAIGDPKTVQYQIAPQDGPSQRPGSSSNEINEAERKFAETANSGLPSAAFRAQASSYVRLHRNGHDPILGIDAAEAFLGGLQSYSHWMPMGSGISASGDMGYSYGRYTAVEGGKPTSGYFARVWKRDRNGVWKVVADIANVEIKP